MGSGGVPQDGDGVIRALLIESDRSHAEILRLRMSELPAGPARSPLHIEWEGSLSKGLRRIAEGGVDVLLLDLMLEDSQGLATFTAVRSEAPGLPVVILSTVEAESMAVLAVQRGAQDYLVKDGLDSNVVARALRYAVERRTLQTESEQQRRRMGRMLRESEDRGRGLFEGVPIGLYRSTPEGLILDANPALADMLGYPYREALLSVDSADLYVNVEDRRRWREQIERDGVLRHFAMRLRRKDGEIIWVEDTARTVRGRDGGVLYYEGGLEDVSDRVHAEEALKASRASFHSIVEASTDGVVVIGRNGLVRFANTAAGDLLGRPVEDLVGKVFEFAMAIGEGAEIDLPSESDEARVADVRVTETEWEGEPAYLASLRDITGRKAAEEALARSEERFRTLVETIPYGVEEIDASGMRLFANRTLHRMYESEEGDLVGKSILDLAPTDSDRERLRKHLERLVREQPPPTTYVGKKVTRTGRVIDVEMAWEYRRDPDGRVMGFTTVIADVTGRKEKRPVLTSPTADAHLVR